MMRDRPYGAELLSEARRVLKESTASEGLSANRYQMLLVDRAMDLAARELGADRGLEKKLMEELARILDSRRTEQELAAELSRRIRDGSYDSSMEIHHFLQLVIAYKLLEVNPAKAANDIGPQIRALEKRQATGSAADADL